MQGYCEDIFCHSFRFRGELSSISGGRSRRSQGRMMRQQSYTSSIRLCQLQATRPFGRVKDSAEVLLDRPLSGPESLTFKAVPSQGDIGRRTETEIYKTQREIRNLHVSLAEAVWKTSSMFSLINGCGESKWALCLTLSSKQQYLSQGVLLLPNHPYWLWLWTDLPSLLAHSRQTHRIIHCLLALSLISFPTSPFLSLSFSGMKPLTGRWADGDRQCSPGRKLIGRDWARIWRC